MALDRSGQIYVANIQGAIGRTVHPADAVADAKADADAEPDAHAEADAAPSIAESASPTPVAARRRRSTSIRDLRSGSEDGIITPIASRSTTAATSISSIRAAPRPNAAVASGPAIYVFPPYNKKDSVQRSRFARFEVAAPS